MRTQRFKRILLTIICIVLCPAFVYSWESKIIVDNGDPANRVDIVFLGDGYQLDELDKYASDVQKVVEDFFQETPFLEYKKYFNIHQVDVISNESGTDHPDQGIYVDTALDSSYNYVANVTRCLYAPSSKVYEAVSDASVAADIILVIVNDSEYGGCGGGYVVFSTHSSASDIAMHELGHSFGHLVDEYFFEGGTYDEIEPNAANVTTEINIDSIKWKHWIEPDTLIPTISTEEGIPGLYEGAAFYRFKIYRSTYSSKMRSMSQPFESVNSEQLVLQMYNHVSPIDSASPSEKAVTIAAYNDERIFQVTPLQPVTHDLRVEWFLNDYLAGAGKEFTLRSNELIPGTNIIKVEVTDPTPLVRNDPDRLLTETKMWEISLLDTHPVINSIENQFVKVKRLLQFDVSVTGSGQLSLSSKLSNGDLIETVGATFVDNGNGTGTFSWIPTFKQGGIDYFIIFTATDIDGLSDSKMIKITVEHIWGCWFSHRMELE